MFGIIRPCRHRLAADLHAAWLAHLCGLCLALRDEHGQLARVVTNYDGLVISALVDAQAPATSRRTAGPCPLRGMRGAQVSTGEGARLAASVSLVLAAAKVRDHAQDGDGTLARLPGARPLARRWAEQGARSGRAVGFDTTLLLDAVERQAGVEARAGVTLLEATEPTETATAAACAHTAVLAGRPGNAQPLREAGRLFGRVAHLLDAVQDLDADAAHGSWNPIAATGTPLAEVRRLCDDAVLGVALALREIEFTDSALVHALLVHELRQAVHRTFASVPPPGGPPRDGPPPIPPPPRRRGVRGFVAGCASATALFCGCGACRNCGHHASGTLTRHGTLPPTTPRPPTGGGAGGGSNRDCSPSCNCSHCDCGCGQACTSCTDTCNQSCGSCGNTCSGCGNTCGDCGNSCCSGCQGCSCS